MRTVQGKSNSVWKLLRVKTGLGFHGVKVFGVRARFSGLKVLGLGFKVLGL